MGTEPKGKALVKRRHPGRGALLGAALIVLYLAVGPAAGQKSSPAPQVEVATFAGGCFWCVEEAFDAVEGVLSTTSGFTGGRTKNPTYEQVSAGGTGHAESVQVRFDPRQVSYAKLLRVFWHNIDPTTPNRQFCDFGSQYRPEIFFHSEAQKQLALASKAEIEKSKPFPDPIRVNITPAAAFYNAEEYHQDFHMKNPLRYKFYKYNCGRAQRLKQLWGENP